MSNTEDIYNATLATPTHCSFCDDYAVGARPAPSGPWAYCVNHHSAAHAEARADREMEVTS